MDFSTVLLWVIPIFMIVYGIYVSIRRTRLKQSDEKEESKPDSFKGLLVFSIGSVMLLVIICFQYIFAPELEPESSTPMVMLAFEIVIFFLSFIMPSLIAGYLKGKR